MINLIPMEHNTQRVLITQQLADVYGCGEERIRQSYSRNKNKFQEGKHYYKLTGDELKAFKAEYLNDTQSKFIKELMLWTEKGASRHCKILDTDKAWEQFDNLEETYFRVKEQVAPQFKLPQTYPDALRALAEEVEYRQALEEWNRVLAPKAEYTDKVLAAEDLITTTQIAKDYGMSALVFNKILHDLKIQYKTNGQWVLRAEYDDKGYVQSDSIFKEDRYGEQKLIMYTKWTQSGRHFLYNKLKELGILPLKERAGA